MEVLSTMGIDNYSITSVKTGECFLCDGELYIQTDTKKKFQSGQLRPVDYYGCVNLHNGVMHYFKPSAVVTKVNAKAVIHQIYNTASK